MSKIVMLCAGIIGAANPGGIEAGSPKPFQVAEGYSIASGGCYQPAAYQPRVERTWTGNYAANYPAANCAGGACYPSQSSAGTAYCPGGQCDLRSTSAGAAANCANGQCRLRQPAGNYVTYPAGSRLPGGRYPASLSAGFNRSARPAYSSPRFDRSHRANTIRPASLPTYGGSASPFFD